MKILYVYAHPNPASFNGMMKQRAVDLLTKNQHQVIVSDLYAKKFNAVASWDDFDLNPSETNPQYFLAQQQAYNEHKLAEEISAELKHIAWAEHIIFQFPLWWFSTPGILKGWLDRVLVKGFAYDAGKVFKDGLLQGKTAALVTSTQSPESAYQVDGVHGAVLDTFLHHIHHTLRFVGITPRQHFVTYAAFNLDETRQQQIINDYCDFLKKL